MTKYITVKLTEDQLKDVIKTLSADLHLKRDLASQSEMSLNPEFEKFRIRLMNQLAQAKTK